MFTQKEATEVVNFECELCLRKFISKFEYHQHKLTHLVGEADTTDSESEDDLPLNQLALPEPLQKSPSIKATLVSLNSPHKLAVAEIDSLAEENEDLMALEIPGLEMVSDKSTDSGLESSDKDSIVATEMQQKQEQIMSPNNNNFIPCETCEAFFKSTV